MKCKAIIIPSSSSCSLQRPRPLYETLTDKALSLPSDGATASDQTSTPCKLFYCLEIKRTKIVSIFLLRCIMDDLLTWLFVCVICSSVVEITIHLQMSKIDSVSFRQSRWDILISAWSFDQFLTLSCKLKLKSSLRQYQPTQMIYSASIILYTQLWMLTRVKCLSVIYSDWCTDYIIRWYW